MSHIFISYSTKNSKYVARLAEKLRDEGFNIWIDNSRLRSGEHWWESIVLALRNADAFVVIMTPESRRSEWVQREVALANQWNKPCFPILLKGENFEYYVLSNFEDVRDGSLPDPGFYDDLEEHTTRLNNRGKNVTIAEAVQMDVDADTEIRKAIENPPGKSKRRSRNLSGWFVTGGAILLVLAFLAWSVMGLTPAEPPPLPTFTPQPSPTATTSCTSSLLVLTGWKANGIGIYGDHNDEDEANVYQYPNGDVYPEFIAHAQLIAEQNWYLVEHPTRQGFFGWVQEEDVIYDRNILHCLPTYSRNTFPRDTHPIFTGN